MNHMDNMLKKMTISIATFLLIINLIIAVVVSPFIAGHYVITHPVQTIGYMLGGTFDWLEGLFLSDSSFGDDPIITFAEAYLEQYPTISNNINKAIEELKNDGKEGSAITKNHVAIPFFLSGRKEVSIQHAKDVGIWIYENCRDTLDRRSFANYIATDTKFAEDINRKGWTADNLYAILTNQNADMITGDSNNNIGDSGDYAAGPSELGNQISQKALTRLGNRYWWGAPGGGFGDGQGLDNPNARYFDCSGLVAWAHRQSGVMIGRTTAAGYSGSGKAISYNELQTGDVITFKYSPGGAVAHIGIYIGNGKMVHAAGAGSGTRGQYPNECVTIDDITPGSYWYRFIHNCRRLY